MSFFRIIFSWHSFMVILLCYFSWHFSVLSFHDILSWHTLLMSFFIHSPMPFFTHSFSKNRCPSGHLPCSTSVFVCLMPITSLVLCLWGILFFTFILGYLRLGGRMGMEVGFFSLIPTLRLFCGYELAFFLLIPILDCVNGYFFTFSSYMPTLYLLGGYKASFFLPIPTLDWMGKSFFTFLIFMGN